MKRRTRRSGPALRVIEITGLPGDGDPQEYGRRLPNGRWFYHPPYGPTQIKEEHPYMRRSRRD